MGMEAVGKQALGMPHHPLLLPHHPARGRQGAPEQSAAVPAQPGSSSTVPMTTVTTKGPSPASPRQQPRAWQRLPRQEEPEPGAAPGVFWGWG